MKAWSQAVYPFRKKASGWRLQDVGYSVVKLMGKVDRDKMINGLASCESRMHRDDYAEYMNAMNTILHPISVPFHWKDQGVFNRELEIRDNPDIDRNELESKMSIVSVPEAILALTHAGMRRNIRNELRSVKLVFNSIIAVRMEHADTDEKKRKPHRFYLGIVQHIFEDFSVSIRWLNAPSEFGKYTLWRGRNQIETIELSSIICVLKILTKTMTGKIKPGDVLKIKAALADPSFSLFSVEEELSDDSEDPREYGIISSDDESDSEDREEKSESKKRRLEERKFVEAERKSISAPGPQKKRRGRPPGSKNKPKP